MRHRHKIRCETCGKFIKRIYYSFFPRCIRCMPVFVMVNKNGKPINENS